jgi:predicted dehydrogenase
LEAGLDVFVEKPLAKTSNECKKIADLARKNGCHIMVGHQLRFYNPIEEIKQIIDEGSLGTIEVVTLEEVTNGPFSHPVVPSPVAEWWFDKQKVGGGALLDIGCHMIDLYQFLVGDPDLLFAKLEYRLHLPVEDGAILVLKSANSSADGIVNVGWYSKQGFGRLNLRVIIHGNAGFISSDDLIGGAYSDAAKAVFGNLFRKITGRKIKPLSYNPVWEAHYKALSHFFNCVRQDIEPTIGTSAIQASKTVALIEKAYFEKPNLT